ncbi:uncharacterized protein LOC123545572 [Mercenaria mercenaria]|uniref:uncharacterized protein LOC123545572 n=1 Tax=Mercenaria mercenaria TaxID=6596 RepID=UPI00234EE59F|nr:uncharacterized protein LOC123545572 [Mercenaria mercenaria]
MMYCKDSSPLPSAVSRTIGEIIDKNSLLLMQNHAYISVISASSVISKGYGTSNHCIIAKPCIVLSVLAKHYIPINEEPFPTELHGIPVDVRECEFELCGRSAKTFHDKVKMGCKISSTFLPQKHGTLGGFVEHPEYGLCGITCAHVVLSDDLKFELKAKANVKENEMSCCEIFQPFNDPQKQNVIGKQVEVTYKEGGNGTAGVDLALFKLHQRQPTDRTFPDCKSASTIKYESGNVWGQSGIPSDQRKVLKYGFVTGFTYGNIQFENAVVREMDFHSKIEVNKGAEKYTTTLYKQYHIKSDDKKLKFSELGDSGALVFMKEGLDEESELRCIGMVVGVFSDDTCAVTPVTAILKELHVNHLKMFLPNITWEKIENRFRKMEERLMNIEKLVEKALANRNNQSQ